MCEYCEEGKPITEFNSLREMNTIHIRNEDLLHCQIGFSYMYRKINYCPMCGRKLGG